MPMTSFTLSPMRRRRRSVLFLAMVLLAATAAPGSSLPATARLTSSAALGQGPLAAIERAQSSLDDQRVRLGASAPPEAVRALDAQDEKLALARRLFQPSSPGTTGLDRGLTQAHQVLLAQAQQAGAGLALAPASLPQRTVSQAVFSLLERYGVRPSAGQRNEIASLHRLDPAVKDALAGFIDSFLRFDSASSDALSGQAATAPGVSDRLMVARAALVPASHNLLSAFEAAHDELCSLGLPDLKDDLAPALALDLSCSDSSEYDSDVALSIDLGGNDVYNNNAGAGTLETLPGMPAAAAIDVDGNDAYNPAGRGNGRNGGGNLASGFLLDGSGSDFYYTGEFAVNGGAVQGTGALIDLAGDDCYARAPQDVSSPWSCSYEIGPGHKSAVNGGSQEAVGALIDTEGKDFYAGDRSGINGGAYSGIAALVDLSGDDTYLAVGDGTNGAGHQFGNGLLLDGAGTDVYSSNGGNGSGGHLATGALLDLAGTGDQYTDGATRRPTSALQHDESGGDQTEPVLDETEVPKSSALRGILLEGMQFDSTMIPRTGPLAPTSVIMMGDAVAQEGSSATGVTNFVFKVSLAEPASGSVEVGYQALPGSADSSDFTGAASTVTFQQGDVEKEITIQVQPDQVLERDEFFSVFVTSNTNSVVAKRQGIGMIRDDDGGNAPPAISIRDVIKNEGNGGTTSFDFLVRLTSASGNQPVAVKYFASNGTAEVEEDRNDYEAASGSLSFAPGETEKVISVTVNADDGLENTEFLQVFLHDAVNALTAKSQGIGIIVNDDG